MSDIGPIIRGILAVIVFGGIGGYVIVQSVRKADDPARMVFRWILTAVILWILIKKVGDFVGQGGAAGAFIGVPFGAVCGLALAFIWRHQIAGLVANPFGSLYDGGDVEPVPHPAYSMAQARQKQGKYLEAVEEVRKQLARFPTDFEGHMLLAQIQAEDLKDLPACEITIHQWINQPGHSPKNITFALYSLADWHLKIGRDREAAQRALEKIVELFPDSEFALGASHRIAHLGNLQSILSPEERRKFIVEQGVRNLGLISKHDHLKPAETSPGLEAAEYVKHLEQHPFDTEAREKLAQIYADHYSRLDLATDQLEQMIQQPNQSGRLVVRWLNMLADLQIRCGSDYETVRVTLQRIVDLYPKLAAADIAKNRMALLKLEMKSKSPNQAVRMGTYEQNIGLKQGRVPGL